MVFMTTWVVYKHTNRINGKSYIGITKRGVYARWKQHVSLANNGGNTKFSKAIRKYGDKAWDTELLEVGIESADEAKTLEMAYVEKYNTYANGYNSTAGGDSGINGPIVYTEKVEWVHSDFGREYLNPWELHNKYNLHIGALIKVLKGKYRYFKGWQVYNKEKDVVVPFTEKSQTLYNLLGESITVTPSEFSILFNVGRPQVLKLFRGKAKQCRGWALTPENLNKSSHRKVQEFTKCGELVREFETSYSCAKTLEIKPKRVSGWLASRDSFEYNGMIYKYKSKP